MFDNCIDSAWSNAPGRDICISFVSSPPSSRWDLVCCISPEPQLNSRILLFIFLFFCIFALCYLKDNFVVQHFSHLHFSVSAAAETFYCRVFSVSRNKKLKSNFWKLELLQQQKKKYGALLNNCAMFAKMRDIATRTVLISFSPGKIQWNIFSRRWNFKSLQSTITTNGFSTTLNDIHDIHCNAAHWCQ